MCTFFSSPSTCNWFNQGKNQPVCINRTSTYKRNLWVNCLWPQNFWQKFGLKRSFEKNWPATKLFHSVALCSEFGSRSQFFFAWNNLKKSLSQANYWTAWGALSHLSNRFMIYWLHKSYLCMYYCLSPFAFDIEVL